MDLQLMEYKLMLIGMVLFIVFLVGFLYDKMLSDDIEVKEDKIERMIIPMMRG